MPAETEKWINAPEPTFRDAPVAYTGVRVAEDEDVEWIWTHTPKGSYVSGYRIVKEDSSP